MESNPIATRNFVPAFLRKLLLEEGLVSTSLLILVSTKSVKSIDSQHLFLNKNEEVNFVLKSVHFKKTVAQSSFLSKLLSFFLTFISAKMTTLLKGMRMRNCLLKMNGL